MVAETSTMDLIAEIKAHLGLLYDHVREDDVADFCFSIQELASQVQQVCQQDEGMAISTILLKSGTDYLTNHSVDSAIVCELVSQSFDYSSTQRCSLISAALSMNIGMLDLQNRLYAHHGLLSVADNQQVFTHPLESVSILQEAGIDDELWLTAVAQHHELMDGSGYPYGLAGEEIHHAARILSLVDSYTAMVSPRAYRLGLNPDKVIRDLFSKQGEYIDLEVARILTQKLGVYPVGTVLKMESGVTGVVVQQSDNLQRPIVRELFDQRKQAIKEYREDVSGQIQGVFQPGREAGKLRDVLYPSVDGSAKSFVEKDTPVKSVARPNCRYPTAKVVFEMVTRYRLPAEVMPNEEDIRASCEIISGVSFPVNSRVLIRLNALMNQRHVQLLDVAELIDGDLLLLGVFNKVYSMTDLEFENQSVLTMLVNMGLEVFSETVLGNLEGLVNNSFMEEYDLFHLYDESCLSARGMAFAAQYLDGVDKRQAYLLGLFQNSGVLLLSQKNKRYIKALENAQLYNQPLEKFERGLVRTTHSLIGFILGLHWELPVDVCCAILHHHSISVKQIPSANIRTLVSMSKLIQHIVNQSVFGQKDFYEWENNNAEVSQELGLMQGDYNAIDSFVRGLAAEL